MRRCLSRALVALLVLTAPSSALASARVGVRNDSDPTSVPPPALATSPLYEVDAVSPCNGHIDTYNTYDGNNVWDISHGVVVGCGVPTQISCVTNIKSATGAFNDTVAASGSAYCNAYRYNPGFKLHSAQAQAEEPFTHNVTFTMTLSPPYFWQYTTILCDTLDPTKRIITCKDTGIEQLGFNQNDLFD